MVLNRPMPLPSAENIFFLLAIHGSRHRWESLKWICDIAALLHAFPELDWDAVLARASKIARKRLALLPLALVNQLFHVPLPASVSKAIEQDAAISRTCRSHSTAPLCRWRRRSPPAKNSRCRAHLLRRNAYPYAGKPV